MDRTSGRNLTLGASQVFSLPIPRTISCDSTPSARKRMMPPATPLLQMFPRRKGTNSARGYVALRDMMATATMLSTYGIIR